MQELISPAQSEQLILLLAAILLLGGAALGAKVRGLRGMVLGLTGPMVFGLWQFHKWITRNDLQREYFGLDKVWVLGLEIVLFVALGAAVGIVWKKVIAKKDVL